jgi:ketosteroid isomerase-like protein
MDILRRAGIVLFNRLSRMTSLTHGQMAIPRCGENRMENVVTSVEARNKSLVCDRFEAWARGSGSPLELLADDASWTIEGGSAASKTYEGRETFMREVIGPFNARMSVRLTPTVRELCADGDIVIIFFDARGTAREALLNSLHHALEDLSSTA